MDYIDNKKLQLNLDLSELRALIFDFDGTLVDSEPIWKEVFVDLYLEKYDVELNHKLLWENTGNGVEAAVGNVNNFFDLEVDEKEFYSFIQELSNEAYERILGATPRTGLVDVLDWAKENNIVMAICSASSKGFIEKYLANHSLEQYFVHITSTSNYEQKLRKPNPYPYTQTLEILGLDTNQALAFEDSPSGTTGAMSAGIKTIVLANEFLYEELEKLEPISLLQDFRPVFEYLVSSRS